ncbi:shikimate kinase [Desulfobulbus alkaliphilus]|uniref:shikimate kinase n=1 Tax=Desulfobulbus alkaliphilus TaxID=869814 RepID=UPI001965FF5E|nr:shikimate kinase [Desulfobulbus alkaliphilus]MBM9537483.1 shikimate kinase [Desulfobulbus alkaliphilus]
MIPSNLTLIGMPGAGKTTVGLLVAKSLSLNFIDTDSLIEVNQGKTLQQIVDDYGHLHLRAIEEKEILAINLNRHVIATGGSAVYSAKAMAHLQRLSTIVFLQVSRVEIERRINNFNTRGIAKSTHQTFQGLYDERQVLYARYAGMTIPCDGRDQDEVVRLIMEKLK